MELVKIAPENLEVANAYLEFGSIPQAATALAVKESEVSEIINKREVRAYIDSVYLDQGYRNRFKLAETLDRIIDAKLAEAEESEMYSTKDLADLLAMAHKMRMDELKLQNDREKATTVIKKQNNVQINESPYGQGNYGKLMQRLLENNE